MKKLLIALCILLIFVGTVSLLIISKANSYKNIITTQGNEYRNYLFGTKMRIGILPPDYRGWLFALLSKEQAKTNPFAGDIYSSYLMDYICGKSDIGLVDKYLVKVPISLTNLEEVDCLKFVSDNYNTPFYKYWLALSLEDMKDYMMAEKYYVASEKDLFWSRGRLLNFYYTINNNEKKCAKILSMKNDNIYAVINFFLRYRRIDDFYKIAGDCGFSDFIYERNTNMDILLKELNVEDRYISLISNAFSSFTEPQKALDVYHNLLESNDDVISGIAAYCIYRAYTEGEVVEKNDEMAYQYALKAINKGIKVFDPSLGFTDMEAFRLNDIYFTKYMCF